LQEQLESRRDLKKGERRYKPEEEPRIVGEPAPQQAGGFSYDPEVEKEKIRVQALGQLQTARIANRRLDIEARQLEINKLLADRERGERQRQFNIEDIRSRERLDIEGRQLQSLLDRQADDRDRFEEDIRQRKKERRLQRDLQERALETEEFRTEEEKRLRELEIGKRDVIEAEKLRVHDELKSRELDLLERRLDLDTQRATADPIPEGLSHADREFLQRGFERGLETLERRFGENEARIQEQIRTHADRVARQQPVEIKLVQPEQRGASAEQIASDVREALKEFRSSPRRRLSIESASTDTSEEEFSPRGARAGRVSPPPEEEELVFEGLQEEAVGFSPVQTPRPTLKKAEPTPLTAEEISQPIEGLPETERREPEPEEPEESGVFAGGIEAAAQNAIGFVGDVAGRAARGIAGLFEPGIGEQTGGRLDPEGQVFGLGQEIEFPIPTIQPVPSAEPERRPAVVETSSSSANLTPERIRINRDILESNIQANSERYQTEFADKFKEEEERLRQGWLQEHYSKKPSLSSDDKERIRRAVFKDPLGDLYKPEFNPAKYQSRSKKYITKNKDKQLEAKSDLYKQQLDKQKNLLKDVDERLQSKKLDFSSQEAGLSYVESLTENEPQKILSGPPVLPPKASGKVEEVEEEQPKIEALGEGEGLLEEEVQAVIQPSEMNTNLRLFESMEGEIDAYYTRGRAQGGARGDLPFMITNLTDKTFKGLAPGQSVVLSQIEKDGKIGYFPGSRIRGEKVGITRMGRDVLIKQIKSGKLKVDRVR
jgi:hypothetical protein